ncbi:hypothetical protein C8R42DRAFT_647380 [Lentinula raphanica]|nr:hypothetical protein C8R42DRAFT_647380 [Lentinula raphanica]
MTASVFVSSSRVKKILPYEGTRTRLRVAFCGVEGSGMIMAWRGGGVREGEGVEGLWVEKGLELKQNRVWDRKCKLNVNYGEHEQEHEYTKERTRDIGDSTVYRSGDTEIGSETRTAQTPISKEAGKLIKVKRAQPASPLWFSRTAVVFVSLSRVTKTQRGIRRNEHTLMRSFLRSGVGVEIETWRLGGSSGWGREKKSRVYGWRKVGGVEGRGREREREAVNEHDFGG